jgi:hypothetical protein
MSNAHFGRFVPAPGMAGGCIEHGCQAALWEVSLNRAERRVLELEEFVRRAAVGKRPDGTYNFGREALEQQAKELLRA